MRGSWRRALAGKLRKILRTYFLLFFLLLVLTLTFATGVDLGELWRSAAALKPWQVAVLLCGYAVIAGVSIATRAYLLRGLGFRTRPDHLALIHFTSMAAHYSTPAKIGFPLSVYLLNKVEGVSYAAATAMILIELVTGLAVCGAFAAVGALQYFSVNLPGVIVGVGLLVCGCIGLAVGSRLLRRGDGRGGRLRRFVTDVGASFRGLPASRLVTYCALMAFCQVLSGAYLVLLLHFLGASVSVWQAMVANSTAFFLGAVSMIPMGLGVSEVSMLFYLGQFGVANEVAIAAIAVQRLLITGVTYLLGLLAGSILGVKNMRTAGQGSGPAVGDSPEADPR